MYRRCSITVQHHSLLKSLSKAFFNKYEMLHFFFTNSSNPTLKHFTPLLFLSSLPKPLGHIQHSSWCKHAPNTPHADSTGLSPATSRKSASQLAPIKKHPANLHPSSRSSPNRSPSQQCTTPTFRRQQSLSHHTLNYSRACSTRPSISRVSPGPRRAARDDWQLYH
jgi:hypothetical protein